MLHILFVHVHVVDHFLLRQVWELSAIDGPDCVDGAHIGFPVKELARGAFVHPLPLAVLIQPFFPELLYGHIQVGRDALQILKGVCGRHRAAAIGAGQTICFLPYLFVGNLRIGVQRIGRIVFKLCKKPSQPGAVFRNTIRKLPSEIRHMKP
jgi:hypothetical protein